LRDELARVPDEHLQEVPLRGSQAHLPVGGRDPVGAQVNGERVGLDKGVRCVAGGGTSQRGADPGEQFIHPERLGDVVVGAGVECGDLLVLRVPCRQHEDGRRAPAAQPADNFDAVEVG
jgi:hypothetical protein